ncbi:hypothetical protein [Dickeya dadantii]|uniref:hypothetical protein n=1 Tax=Dickeya dadantii TaxID=204038 RepID=UPI003019FC40
MALIMDRFARYGKCFFVPSVSFVYNIDNLLPYASPGGRYNAAMLPPKSFSRHRIARVIPKQTESRRRFLVFYLSGKRVIQYNQSVYFIFFTTHHHLFRDVIISPWNSYHFKSHTIPCILSAISGERHK